MALPSEAPQLDPETSRHDLRWIRPPRQARTHQSLERLLDIAEAMLQERDFDAIHVSELASRAETSVAAFYRRFKDKDALLHALHERHCEEAYATADDALEASRWEGANVSDILHTIFPFLVNILHSNEHLDRAILQRVVTDEAMRERQMQLSRYVVSGITKLLLSRGEEIRHPDPELAASMGFLMLLAMLRELVLFNDSTASALQLDDHTIESELIRAYLRYLGSPEGEKERA